MIGWQPRLDVPGPWHLTESTKPVPFSSLCGTRVSGIERYVKRDPHKIDDYNGERCPRCWSEWRLRTGASLAVQDQRMAASTREQKP